MPRISRRDFLNGVALTVASGWTPAAQIAADPARYPPALTGLRGQHQGSFETAHEMARAHQRHPIDGLPIEESYDLALSNQWRATPEELRRADPEILAGMDDLIPELVQGGLMGIECYYQEHSTAQTASYLEMCKEWGLVATGGSDYHGPHLGRPNPLGTPSVPLATYEQLKSLAAAS